MKMVWWPLSKGMSSHGFSLIEIIVVMLLASLLMIGMTKIFVGFRRSERVQHNILVVTHTARVLTLLFRHRMMQAGDVWCDNKKNHSNVASVQAFHYPAPRRLRIHSDAQSDILLLSLCRRVHHKNSIIKVAYYIAKTTRVMKNSLPIYALYEKPLKGRRMELIDHVRRMTLSFMTFDQKKQKIKMGLSPGQVSNWKNVRAVLIKTLIRSDHVMPMAKRDYWYDEKSVKNTDSLLIQPWYIVVALRNGVTVLP